MAMRLFLLLSLLIHLGSPTISDDDDMSVIGSGSGDEAGSGSGDHSTTSTTVPTEITYPKTTTTSSTSYLTTSDDEDMSTSASEISDEAGSGSGDYSRTSTTVRTEITYPKTTTTSSTSYPTTSDDEDMSTSVSDIGDEAGSGSGDYSTTSSTEPITITYPETTTLSSTVTTRDLTSNPYVSKSSNEIRTPHATTDNWTYTGNSIRVFFTKSSAETTEQPSDTTTTTGRTDDYDTTSGISVCGLNKPMCMHGICVYPPCVATENSRVETTGHATTVSPSYSTDHHRTDWGTASSQHAKDTTQHYSTGKVTFHSADGTRASCNCPTTLSPPTEETTGSTYVSSTTTTSAPATAASATTPKSTTASTAATTTTTTTTAVTSPTEQATPMTTLVPMCQEEWTEDILPNPLPSCMTARIQCHCPNHVITFDHSGTFHTQMLSTLGQCITKGAKACMFQAGHVMGTCEGQQFCDLAERLKGWHYCYNAERKAWLSANYVVVKYRCVRNI